MGKNILHYMTKLIGHSGRFFVPKRSKYKTFKDILALKKTIAIIPTFCPSPITYKLVADLLNWHPELEVIVVDDSTPLTYKNRKSVNVLNNLKKLAGKNKRLKLLRTPQNKLKAGALNFGIEYIQKQNKNPHVIVTFDDDVAINKDTLLHVVSSLYGRPHVGVVCSMSKVRNKNVNILTRLQALEYHGFNITKIADDGFLYGPLVMQGMLSAFRYEAIKQVNGFTTGHLIEDYDITVRIKQSGWHAGIASSAMAWTDAPHTLSQLWKQRVRWSYGGIGVVKNSWRSTYTVFQDLVGHALFLVLFALIIASFVIPNNEIASPAIITALVIIAVLHFVISFSFNVLTLITYPERDKFDWIIKLSILPEFIYSNILTLILLGSYIYFVFNSASKRLVKVSPKLKKFQTAGLNVFQKLGYSMAWGTRS